MYYVIYIYIGEYNFNLFVRESFPEEAETQEYSKINFGMIPWKQCNQIVSTSSYWISLLNNEIVVLIIGFSNTYLQLIRMLRFLIVK
jgi:hypothetical protein